MKIEFPTPETAATAHAQAIVRFMLDSKAPECGTRVEMDGRTFWLSVKDIAAIERDRLRQADRQSVFVMLAELCERLTESISQYHYDSWNEYGKQGEYSEPPIIAEAKAALHAYRSAEVQG
jgi:hypothetical protein